MPNLNKFFVFLVLLLVVVGSILFLQGKSSEPIKFFGTIKDVKSSSIIVMGKIDKGVKDLAPLKDVEVKVTSGTEIIKTSFVRPPQTIPGELFYVDKLPKETRVADFATLKEDSKHVSIGVEITLKKSFLGKVIYEAEEIKYISPKY